MKTFRELCNGKPSNAVKAMIEGLKRQDARTDFTIRMGTFGEAFRGLCFGCAATCTIQEISKITLTASNIEADFRAEALNVHGEDLRRFEKAIDAFRVGAPLPLLEYFDVPLDMRGILGRYTVWELRSHNWRGQLPMVGVWNRQLIDLGL